MADPPAGHQHLVRVYYEDTAAGGIVYHASYLRFAERARTEALRAMGVPHAALVRDHGLMFVVRRIKLDYLRPARVDDSVLVVTTLQRLGAASVELGQAFARRGETLARAEIALACVGIESGRPSRMPARWRAAFVRMGVATGMAGGQ